MSISKVIELLNGGTIDVDSVVVGDKPVSGGWLAHYDKKFRPIADLDRWKNYRDGLKSRKNKQTRTD